MPELNQATSTHQIHELLSRVIASDYPFLKRLQPSLEIRVILATPDKEGQPAVKNGKRAVAAFLDIVPYRWRIRGAGDVGITIDTAEWADMTPDEQTATLAGEIESMEFQELREIGDGLICDRDRAERPIIKKRQPDVVVSGYSAVIQRYGDAAEARKELDRANSRLRQKPLPFDDLPRDTTISFNSRPINSQSDMDDAVGQAMGIKPRRTRKAEVDEMFAAQTA